nr:HAMP domain-containing histidine kinase [Lachnospiraceae bacterium]
LSMFLTMNNFQKTLIEKQDDNIMQFAGVTDRALSNILRSGLADLRYAARQPKMFQAEQLWRETGNVSELNQNMSTVLANIGDVFIGTIAVSKGKVIAASDVSYAYAYYDADRFVNNEAGLDLDYVTRLKDGKETTTLAIVVPNLGKDISYAALFDMKELYRKVANTSVEGDKRILFYCGEYNVFVHEPGDYRSASSMDPMIEDTIQYPELLILVDRENGSMRSADTYTKKSRYGEETMYRIAVLPSSINRNGIFAVAVIDSYENTIHPIRQAVIDFGGSMLITFLGVGLMIFVVFHLNRADIRQQREIELLKVRQKETQEVMERTQELAHNQRLTIIGTMTASIAHEFNNLLTPIMGYSIMTLDKLPENDTESYDNVIEIYEAARKAKAIISRLSLLSRKTAPSELLPCSPDKIAENAIDSVKPLRPDNVEIVKDLNCADRKINANEIELNQLLLNLIINSIHAIGEKEGRIIVGTEPVEDGVRFTVRDNGPGIPTENLHKIYDPFFTTKESGKGTGLGLAIAVQVVQNHNGRISVDTEEGKGCCFTVFIPEKQPEEKS